MRVFLGWACLAVASCHNQADDGLAPIASCLPEETLFLLDVPLGECLDPAFRATALWEWAQGEVTSGCLGPPLARLQEYLAKVQSEELMLPWLVAAGPTRVAFAVVDLHSDGDGDGDSYVYCLLACDFPKRGSSVWSALSSYMRASAPTWSHASILGHPAIRSGDEDDVAVLQDGDRIVWAAWGPRDLEPFLRRPARSLANAPGYRAVQDGLRARPDLPCFYWNWRRQREVDADARTWWCLMNEDGSREEQRALLLGDSLSSCVWAAGGTVVPAGEDLEDCLLLWTPQGRSDWSRAGELGMRPSSMVRWLPAETAFAACAFLDVPDLLARREHELQRREPYLGRNSPRGLPGKALTRVDLELARGFLRRMRQADAHVGSGASEAWLQSLGHTVWLTAGVFSDGSPALLAAVDLRDPEVSLRFLDSLASADPALPLQVQAATAIRDHASFLISDRSERIPQLHVALAGDALVLATSRAALEAALDPSGSRQLLEAVVAAWPADARAAAWWDCDPWLAALPALEPLLLRELESLGDDLISLWRQAPRPDAARLLQVLGEGNCCARETSDFVLLEGRSRHGTPVLSLPAAAILVLGVQVAGLIAQEELAEELEESR